MKQKEPTLIKEIKRAAKDRKGRQEHTTGNTNCSFCLTVFSPSLPSMKSPFYKGTELEFTPVSWTCCSCHGFGHKDPSQLGSVSVQRAHKGSPALPFTLDYSRRKLRLFEVGWIGFGVLGGVVFVFGVWDFLWFGFTVCGFGLFFGFLSIHFIPISDPKREISSATHIRASWGSREEGSASLHRGTTHHDAPAKLHPQEPALADHSGSAADWLDPQLHLLISCKHRICLPETIPNLGMVLWMFQKSCCFSNILLPLLGLILVPISAQQC